LPYAWTLMPDRQVQAPPALRCPGLSGAPPYVHVVDSGCSPCEPVPFARAGTLPVAHAEAPVRSSQRVAATCHSGSAVSLTAAPVSPALAHLTANTHVLGSFYFVRGSGFS
jgi:hypothetical protein